jgi:hypothetical protein
VVSNEVQVNAGTPSTGMVLHHNVLPAHNNTVFLKLQGTGIQTNDTSAGLVNNIIRVPVGSLCFMDNGHPGTKGSFLNNLLYGCLAKYYTGKGTLLTSVGAVNDLDTTYSESEDNITGSPKFVSETLGVLSLEAISPAVDAGYDTISEGFPGILVFDVERLPRPVDSMEIGAHEHQGN